MAATSLELASPISWQPSQYWENGDRWSSFSLRVGNPAQIVRVLISTAGQATWVVSDQGCVPASFDACEKDRGGLFESNASQTWKELCNFSLGLENNLGPSDNATFGLESVALDISNATGGPPLTGQVVAAISGNQYTLGMFGLGQQPTNLSNFTTPHPSFLTVLRDQHYIPSLSWGYTAGARYQLKGVFGSLTLGGYDASRFTPNDVSFNLAPDISRDLVVGLQKIISSESNGSQNLLLPSPHLTFIDSTIPYIYLPPDACALFVQVFGLKWNETVGLYIIDDELHQELLTRQPKFTFVLGNSMIGGPTVEIVLPYSSFDLTFKPSYAADPIRYFPLLPSTDDSQLTLGRAFLQEAYLITNYEYNNFSVSQCMFQEPMIQNLQRILPSGFQDPELRPAAPPNPPNSSRGRSATGFHFDRATTIGVIVGSVVGLLLLLAISYRLCICWSRRNKHKVPEKEIPRCPPQEIEHMFINKSSTQVSQSTSSLRSIDKFYESDRKLAQEIDTSDWNLAREIPDTGVAELPDMVFELPQSNRSGTPSVIGQRPKKALHIQPPVDRTRRWGHHFSTDGLLSRGNVVKRFVDLTSPEDTSNEPPLSPQTPSLVSPQTPSTESSPSRPCSDRPPTPPPKPSYHHWTKFIEERHDRQGDDDPSPLDPRYKHRIGFF
ncbi:MAG: hypothetical protein Q9168_006433 [Polycauliona sp. 1 TL-2023]